MKGLLNKFKEMSTKGRLIVLGVCFVVICMSVNSCGSDTNTTNTTETSTVKQKETVKEENKSIEDYAKEVFGDDFDNMRTNENMLIVETYVETYWSNDSLTSSYKSDTLDFLEKIKNNDELKDYDSVRIICRAAGTDKYGNDTKILALSSTYLVEDIEKINFENMTDERLYNDFDQQKFVHPAINK